VSKNWRVFQTDVLDLLRQYRGFFNSFERVGSLRDNSRPDAFARITREEKKEVWVLDAKNKADINEEDEKRMQKYIDQVARNPTDVGLEISELSDHSLRGIFITPEQASSDYNTVEFKRLHQFLQKELIYTDTDKIVRDVAKMAERKELSQSQARLLNNSLKPFRDRLDRVRADLEKLEREFVGLNLYTPPFNELDFSPASDAVLTHKKREGVFLIDIPYSPEEAQKSEQKAREVGDRIEEKAFYASIHRFDENSEFSCPPEQFKKHLTRKLGIMSPRTVAELYEPKIEVEKIYEDGYIVLKSDRLGFYLRVESEDDINHRIEASLNREAVSKMKDVCNNARKKLGEFETDRWKHQIKVGEDLEIHHEKAESLESYRDTVKSIFHSAVNPVYSKKVAKKVTEK
jgi:hypothetical protein